MLSAGSGGGAWQGKAGRDLQVLVEVAVLLHVRHGALHERERPALQQLHLAHLARREPGQALHAGFWVFQGPNLGLHVRRGALHERGRPALQQLHLAHLARREPGQALHAQFRVPYGRVFRG